MEDSHGAKRLLSLCVIARDEAHNLPRLLASSKPWVGETILVDTGSLDDTAEIATRLGARVLHRPWQNSFATARNHSLEQATLPWALVLDADEELVVTDPAGLLQALQSDHKAYAIDCHDLRDDGTYAVAPLLRLFQHADPEMRYEGTVHEQLMGVARGHVAVVRATFMHFRHDGHTASVLVTRNKDERNLSLARAQVTAATQEPFAWFCLGQALLTVSNRDRQEQALVAFAQAVAHLNSSHEGEAFVVSLFAGYANTLKQLGRNEESLHLLNAAISAFPGSPDLHLMRGNLLVVAAQLLAAEHDFRSCLSDDAKTFFVRLNPGSTGYEARVGLGLCLLKQGKIEEAKVQLLGALGEAPDNDTRATSLLAAIGNR